MIVPISKSTSMLRRLLSGSVLLVVFLAMLPAAKAQSTTTKPAKTAVKPHNDVQIALIDTTDAELPPDFRVAIYENLVSEVTKSGQFLNVYRAGDERAKSSASLLTLTASAKKFNRGNETTRAVTTVGGATTLTVHVKLADKDGKLLVDKDVGASVRFFGENLRATQGLAKHIVETLGTT